jgi:hypothetical protein
MVHGVATTTHSTASEARPFHARRRASDERNELAPFHSITSSARAQQRERMRRIGVLVGGPNDATFRSRFAAFQQALQQLDWIEGRNIEFNIRWGSNDAERLTAESRELVRGRPDAILVEPGR